MPSKPKISEDEAFVRSHWKDVAVHGLMGPGGNGWIEVYKGTLEPMRLGTRGLHFDKGSAWSDARKYTQAHLAKIAEVQQELDTLTWVTSEYKSLEGEKTTILFRTIARLVAIANQLEEGMIRKLI